MRIMKVSLAAIALALLIGPVGRAVREASSAVTVKKPAQATPLAAEAEKPVVVGSAGSARWTPTTLEAATAEANKKVLAGGRPQTVTGEVVDVSCWLQLGKRGEAHIPCGSKCIANGQPIGILGKDEKLHLLFAEEHHPRRDGQTEIRKVFAPLLAKTVTVTGMATEVHGYDALFVNAGEIGALRVTATDSTATR